jgi:hypothetical protein
MSPNLSRTRELLQNFEFGKLFIEELGWSNPNAVRETGPETPYNIQTVSNLQPQYIVVFRWYFFEPFEISLGCKQHPFQTLLVPVISRPHSSSLCLALGFAEAAGEGVLRGDVLPN